MDKKYFKVVKDFGSAKKGDNLYWDENEQLFGFSITEDNRSRSMYMDEDYANKLIKEGMLVVIELDTTYDCDSCLIASKLEKVSTLVNDLLEQYEKDFNEVQDKYNEQEIPTCVKVEAETVYYNLNKVLTAIKEIIAK